MSRARRRGRHPLIQFLLLAVALTVASLLLAPLAQGVPAAQSAAAQSAAAQRRTAQAVAPPLSESAPLTDLVACLADRKVGDLVLLVDTSGSLGGSDGTDPTAVRVAAAEALVTRLAASFAQIDAKVDVSIAGFDDDVTPVVDFVPLNVDAVPGLNAAVQTFATRDKGAETDYWSALTWLNRTMQAKTQARGNQIGLSCQFALWFTDGEFTISARDGQNEPGLDPLNSPTKDIPGFEGVPLNGDAAKAAKEAAETELCRVGGPADQMRAAGITLIGVGLGGTGADDPTFSFMRNYVENASGQCGGQPSHGVFVPAASVGDLFLALDRIGQLGEATTTTQVQVCAVQACPEGTYSFALDNTLSKVHLAAVVDDGSGALIRSGIQVEITPPNGASPMSITGDGPDTGNVSTASAAAAYQWYPGGPLTIDLSRTQGQDWSGQWQITFVDTTGQHPNAVSNISLSLTSDFAVAPEVPSGTPWRAGQDSGPIVFHPQTLAGADVPLTALPPSFTATATLTMPGQAGTTAEIPVSLTEPTTIAIPEDTTPGLAVIRVDLNGQVAGQPLGTVSRQLAVQVVPPFSAPFPVPNQIVDFGSIEGTAAAAATVAVTGPVEGDGCVRIADGNLINTPPKVTSVAIAGPGGSDCYPVPAGQTVQVPVTLQPGQEGNGHLEGNLTVQLAPAAEPSRVTEAPVRYRAEMVRLPQQGVKIATLLLALLLGLLIPLALIWLVRRLSARFPSGEAVALQSIVLQIKVGAGGLTMADGSPMTPPRSGWVAVPAPGPGRRSLMLSGVLLAARAGWRLTEPGYAEIDDAGAGDSVGACGVPPHSDGRGRPRLPLAVQGTWTVLVPRSLATSPLSDVAGRLLLVVDTGADDAARQRLIGDVGRDGPAAFDAARERARAAEGTTDVERTGSATGPSSPGYPAFGQPAPGEWGSGEPGARPPAEWGAQPAGGYGGQTAGWGAQPAGGPGGRPADWGGQPAGEWGAQPTGGHGAQPAGEWGAQPTGGQPAGWGGTPIGSPSAAGSAGPAGYGPPGAPNGPGPAQPPTEWGSAPPDGPDPSPTVAPHHRPSEGW